MFAHERSSSFPYSHSSPLTRHEIIAPNPRNEACGSVAIITPPTGYEPNATDNLDDTEVNASFFQDSSIYNLGDNGTESPDAEIDDEHIRNALASPLYMQEQEANASLRQAYHSNEASLQPGARSILASTVLHGCHRKENLAMS